VSNSRTLVSDPNTLAQQRADRGWSQAALAEKSAVSRTEVSAIETGRLVPSVAVALRLAAALGVSVETIFGVVAPQRAIAWAWDPPAADGRRWSAKLGERVLAYPVEETAVGSIPHDPEPGLAVHTGAKALSRPERTLVVAGCDPLAGLIVHEMRAQHGVRVLPLIRSSSRALELLQQGLVHVAGIHFTDAAGHPMNDRLVRSTLGPGYRLVHQLRWDTGIALATTRTERTASALLRAKVRWVNREEGSAARRAFDRLLSSRNRPPGYDHVVRGHRAVAATVSSGWAEAGVCVKPVAAEAGLRFMNLQQEAYELCVADALSDDPRIVALIETLQSLDYRSQIEGTPGCTARDTGQVRPAD
jgi:molybdate-binding protein/DNA-binding XRE family transcriptional regulator